LTSSIRSLLSVTVTVPSRTSTPATVSSTTGTANPPRPSTTTCWRGRVTILIHGATVRPRTVDRWPEIDRFAFWEEAVAEVPGRHSGSRQPRSRSKVGGDAAADLAAMRPLSGERLVGHLHQPVGFGLVTT
jgi:hypothetical protein